MDTKGHHISFNIIPLVDENFIFMLACRVMAEIEEVPIEAVDIPEKYQDVAKNIEEKRIFLRILEKRGEANQQVLRTKSSPTEDITETNPHG